MSTRQLIWQDPDWPNLHFDAALVSAAIAGAQRAQGVVEGKLAVLGFDQRTVLVGEAWSQDAVATAAIEGERLDLPAVRFSVARRLGVAMEKGPNVPRHVDGLLDIMDDAVTRAAEPLSHERLQSWQAALFPTGFSGMTKILVGAYRQHAEPMQIVSGRSGREQVHYEAPASVQVQSEMDQLLTWFNAGGAQDSLVQAALAHLWFETVHPFEDGNGRVGRAIIDLVLARDNGEASRLMRISQRLLEVRDSYYDELELAQHGSLDVTRWVVWFIAQVRAACESASTVIDQALEKARYWHAHQDKTLSARQRKVLKVLLDAGPDGFEGGMSTRKYESITNASRATSSRDLIELEAMGMVRRVGDGRSTRYFLAMPGWGEATP
jgi:Fic family protein